MRQQFSNTAQHYPIMHLPISSGEIENRGARRKFWVTLDNDNTEWLLKFPRPNTGEHWAEKVAAEIGQLFGINTARVELARAGGELATVCRKFIADESGSESDSDSFSNNLHGSEFLDRAIWEYNPNIVWGNRAHNVISIFNAIESQRTTNETTRREQVLTDLASYALLDGLIGNTDRHHDNWMVLHGVSLGKIWMRAAPSFDHASSLGRELTDAHRQRILSNNGILNYLKNGRGGVFLNGKSRRAPSPLHLAQLLCRWQPVLAKDWISRLNAVTASDVQSVINRIPSEFMSSPAKEFAYQVVVSSKAELLGNIR